MGNNKSDINLSDLVTRFGLTISRLSHRMIKNNESAKEAAQEVWYEITKSISSFKGDSDISTWIYTVARRTILNYAKSEITIRNFEINNFFKLEAIDYRGAEQDKREWIKEKCDYCLTAFCHCLSNNARLIFLFRDLADLSYMEISKIMEISEANIRKILSRSRKKVKNFMTDNCIFYNPEGNCSCRIRKEIISVDLHKEYAVLAKAAQLVEFYKKFDEELPRKNYWEKVIAEDVTN
jgi:RNA polymerase sigma factor (sigma-70 family)